MGSIGDSERPEDLRARPSLLIGPDQAPDDREQAAAGNHQTAQVEMTVGAARLTQPDARQRRGQQADRDVDPEDPVPGDALDDGASDDRSDRDREATDASPGAERDPATIRRHRGTQDG